MAVSTVAQFRGHQPDELQQLTHIRHLSSRQVKPLATKQFLRSQATEANTDANFDLIQGKQQKIQASKNIQGADSSQQSNADSLRSNAFPGPVSPSSISAKTSDAHSGQEVQTVSTNSLVVPTVVQLHQSERSGEDAAKQARRQKLQRVLRKLVMMNKMRQGQASSHSVASVAVQATRTASVRRKLWVPAGGTKSMDAYIKEQSNIYSYNEQRIAKEQELPWHIINPENSYKLAWDVVILVLVMFYGFIVPYRIGFQLDATDEEQVFDDIANVLFMLDICFSFRTAFKEDGVLVRDIKRIAAGYMQSWFIIDFVASIPLDWFVNTGGGINKLLRALRLFKLFRLLRLLKLFPRLFQVLETNIKFNPSMIRFLRSFIVMMLMWHCIACSYWWVVRVEYGGYYVCSVEPRIICWVNKCVCVQAPFDPMEVHEVLMDIPDEDYDPGWATDLPADEWVPDVYSANRPESYRYANALFWAVEVTTGIGDDINPKSQIEVAFTTAMTVVGLMMYSLIIGSASSALANMDSTATQRRQTLDKVSAYMRSRKVPAFFQRIIVDFYQHMWTTPMKESDVFKDLPESLRSRLSMVLNRDLIDRIPVFRNMTAEVYIRLVQKLYHNTYLPGEFVIRRGDIPRCIYFVKRGMADAILTNGQLLLTYEPGDFFGEHAILHNYRRYITVRAVDFLDVLQLQKEHLQELYAAAPDFIREIRRVDAQRQQKRINFELHTVRVAHGLKSNRRRRSMFAAGLHSTPFPSCFTSSAIEPYSGKASADTKAAARASGPKSLQSTVENAANVAIGSPSYFDQVLHGGEGTGGIQANQSFGIRRVSSMASMSKRISMGSSVIISSKAGQSASRRRVNGIKSGQTPTALDQGAVAAVKLPASPESVATDAHLFGSIPSTGSKK
jgi:CRP-like cAMP-binding protein